MVSLTQSDTFQLAICVPNGSTLATPPKPNARLCDLTHKRASLLIPGHRPDPGKFHLHRRILPVQLRPPGGQNKHRGRPV
ncbi:hypothetical protein SAMN04488123_101322 [Natribacillus halophilus]|uniref:Uncharacterized protein n=1 Tax=Natribacillus halophilus TaxID=549003 RepID=A0A1G8JNH5_9BACI|nr:hypothetical protein SAMN04488123_101322 [Natribacillus halophilus]